MHARTRPHPRTHTHRSQRALWCADTLCPPSFPFLHARIWMHSLSFAHGCLLVFVVQGEWAFQSYVTGQSLKSCWAWTQQAIAQKFSWLRVGTLAKRDREGTFADKNDRKWYLCWRKRSQNVANDIKLSYIGELYTENGVPFIPCHARFFQIFSNWNDTSPQMAEEVRFGPDRHRFCDKLSCVVGQNELLLFSPCYHGIVSLGEGLDLPPIPVMQACKPLHPYTENRCQTWGPV